MRRIASIAAVATAAMFVTSAVVIAVLANGRGGTETVVPATATHVQLGGLAATVILDNASGGTVYYGINCSTSDWAEIYAATNGCVLPASTQHVLPPDAGPYYRLSFQASSGVTSTVTYAAR